jgi:GntR family transcriptional regulator
MIISNNSYTPIFEQIKNAIINQIVSNELAENEALPSIRELAKNLKISVMTVKKAYDELEKEGYILTRQGKGSFVAPKNLELQKEQKQKEIEEYIAKIVDISKNYEIDKKEVLEIFEFMYGEEKEI